MTLRSVAAWTSIVASATWLGCSREPSEETATRSNASAAAAALPFTGTWKGVAVAGDAPGKELAEAFTLASTLRIGDEGITRIFDDGRRREETTTAYEVLEASKSRARISWTIRGKPKITEFRLTSDGSLEIRDEGDPLAAVYERFDR